MAAFQIVPTGVATLDLLLGGGIPERQSVLITGDPGTGKTILSSQIAFAQAARGKRVVIATLASEAQEKLLQELSGFSFFEPDRVGQEIFIVSAYAWVQKGPKETRDLILRMMKDHKADLLVIDGMRSLRDLWANEAKLRDFLYELNVALAQIGAICLLTTEYPLQKLLGYPEATTVDGIISLSMQRFGGRIVRRAQVAKLRGRAHLTGEHVMHITAGGVHLVPRLEETVQPDPGFTPRTERASFGLTELDGILHGGIPTLSTTLLAGSTGVGKTLLSLNFLAAGAREGKKGLLVTYSEPVPRLIARARAISLDVAPLLEDGSLHLFYRSPVNAEADDLVEEILAYVREHRIERLVVDGIGEIEESLLEKQRIRGLLTSLIIELRNQGTTSIFVKEVAKIAGPDVDFSDTPISVTAENLLFFRHIELRGRLHRVVSVLKMRESGYDPHLREFVITDGGLKFLAPIDTAAGILTGVARPLPPFSPAPERS